MKAYKLFRELKRGGITSLYINKKRILPLNEWLDAECYPTKGFAVRPFWHCTEKPIAPHLSKKGRVWAEVEIEDFNTILRPISQGGLWYLSKKIKIINILTITCPDCGYPIELTLSTNTDWYGNLKYYTCNYCKKKFIRQRNEELCVAPPY